MKRLSINFTVALCLFLSVLLPALVPAQTFAAVKGVDAQRDRTVLYALIRCLKDVDPSDFSDDIYAAQISKWDDMEGISTFKKSMAVGYELDSDDGNADCIKMSLTRAMKPIHKTTRWFFQQIYDLRESAASEDNGDLKYPRLSDDAINKLPGKLNGLMGSYDLAVGEDEYKRRLAVAFWICAEPAPNPPKKDTTTYGGKKYQLRDGAPNEVSVGYDLEAGNGKFACDTLMHWGHPNQMADALSGNPQGSTPGSPGGPATGPGTDDAAGDDETSSCQGAGFSLGWIFCGIIEAVSNFGEEIFKDFIQPMMEQRFIEPTPDNKFYQSWLGFRFLGNIMLIGSLLAIVYSQTRGGGGG